MEVMLAIELAITCLQNEDEEVVLESGVSFFLYLSGLPFDPERS
jgi:hypothetical protein